MTTPGTTTHKLNILLVDDEQEACNNLSSILLEYIDPDINILGMANTTEEAEVKIRELKPDAIFLDIEMPNENAFQFLERIHPFDFEIIFVTAYDDYAIRAFKLNAIDYILKPVNIEELEHAVHKLKEKLVFKKMKDGSAEYNQLSDQILKKKEQHQIILRDYNHYETVPFKNIIYIKAMGSYSSIIYKVGEVEKSITMSRPISEYEDMLDKNMFFRIHRSYLVNCSYIKKLSKEDQISALLTNNVKVPIGRRRFADLVLFLKNHAITDV